MSTARRTDKPLTPSQAWQPFTPRGVAAFAHASFTRLFLAQCATALVVAAVCVWFVTSQWHPVITDAIRELPPSGAIRGGRITNSLTTSTRLAENRALAVIFDLNAAGDAGSGSDIEITLHATALKICGMLGCATVEYPKSYIISLGRDELEPWWGAWRSPLAAALGVLVVMKLLLGWWMLAILGTPLVKVLAFYCDRRVTLAGSFRVAAAALLPGALIFTVGVILYGLGAIDQIRLALFYLVHLFCGIVFLLTAPFFLPRLTDKNNNPFASKSEASSAAEPPEKINPFSPGK